MVDEILKRLGVLESLVSGLRADISAVLATLPHLATKAELKGETGSLHGEMGRLRSELHARDVRMIQWFVGTAIALVAMVFSIVRYLPA